MDATTVRRLATGWLAAAFVVFGVSEAAAQDLTWPQDSRRVGWTEAGVIGGSAVGIGAIRYGWGEPTEPRWIGPVLLDDALRNALYEDGKEIEFSEAASDLLVGSLMTYTIAIDSFGLAGLANDEWDTAFQMSTIAVQSHLLNVLVTTSLKHLIARRRPGFGPCYAEPDGEGCETRPNVSFPSGHTSSAFTGAGLVCVTHELLPLYGGGTADQVACATALGLAATTGLLRVASNNHYLSDIFVGSIIGFSIGYVLPRLVYFGDGTTQTAVQSLTPPPAPVLNWSSRF